MLCRNAPHEQSEYSGANQRHQNRVQDEHHRSPVGAVANSDQAWLSRFCDSVPARPDDSLLCGLLYTHPPNMSTRQGRLNNQRVDDQRRAEPIVRRSQGGFRSDRIPALTAPSRTRVSPVLPDVQSVGGIAQLGCSGASAGGSLILLLAPPAGNLGSHLDPAIPNADVAIYSRKPTR